MIQRQTYHLLFNNTIEVKTATTQANFESTVLKSSGQPKVVTNIHATVTRFGTQADEGLVGGLGGATVGFSSPTK